MVCTGDVLGRTALDLAGAQSVRGVGVASYLAYYPYGYWGRMHGLDRLVIAAGLGVGLAQTWSLKDGPIFRCRPKAVLWQRYLLPKRY